jgi:acyl-coenzyme A synthetase/AMP-(fatty) acid ligase
VRLTQPAELFPPRFLALLAGERIEFMCCVAPQLKLVSDCGSLMTQFDLSSLHTVMTGAESPDPQAMRRWIDSAPALRLLNGYGPTEATCVCTVYTITRDNVEAPLPYPIGRPLAGTACTLLDAGNDGAGELCVAGPQLMLGYRGDAAQTRERLVTLAGRVHYRTGDRVRRLASGDWMYIGRIDDEVKVSGYRIDLRELTTVAEQHPAVLESFAAALASDDSGFRHIVLALRCGQADAHTVATDVRRALAERLPRYMQPRHIRVLASFPRLGSGKLDKHSLACALVHREPATP